MVAKIEIMLGWICSLDEKQVKYRFYGQILEDHQGRRITLILILGKEIIRDGM
jgi:hypothetical protein